MFIIVWARNGIFSPFVAVPAGLFAGSIAQRIVPYSWVGETVSGGLWIVAVCWGAALAHFIFERWLDERDLLRGSSFFFIPTEVWTILLSVAPFSFS